MADSTDTSTQSIDLPAGRSHRFLGTAREAIGNEFIYDAEQLEGIKLMA